ncbi:MAG: hypothetical protein JW832_06535, partial [Deltaproteobacteria bacterium]|nr:hypothetical protein [Deltaproteobacteria bacterium]
FWVVLLTLIMFSFVAYDSYTGHFKLNRIEKSIDLLTQASALKANEKIQEDKELQGIYQDIIFDLKEFTRQNEFSKVVGPSFWKFISGAAPWLVFSLLFIGPTLKREKGSFSSFFMAVVFAAIFGCVGYLIPNLSLKWINYIAYPVGHFFFIMIILLVWQKSKSQ